MNEYTLWYWYCKRIILPLGSFFFNYKGWCLWILETVLQSCPHIKRAKKKKLIRPIIPKAPSTSFKYVKILLQHYVHMGICCQSQVGNTVVKKITLCILKYTWEKEGKERKKHSFISSRVKPVKTLPWLGFCQQSAPRVSVFFLGFGVKNRLMFFFRLIQPQQDSYRYK